ncbi:MAG: hypothetical protein CL608_34215 [Anaerolineaceae bacterium]|jgi:hypothetical protein|nr:hypothetical protein [Anaerolineaceae bacterium]
MQNPFTQQFREMPFRRRLYLMLGGKMTEPEKRERASVIDTRAEVLLREVEAKAKLAEIKAKQSASELAALHLSTWAGAYMTLMVCLFLFATLYLPETALGIVCGLITLVVTSLASILKSIVDGKNDAEEAKKKSED